MFRAPVFALLFAVLLAACGRADPTPTPAPVPTFTNTPPPTETPAPTDTPAPRVYSAQEIVAAFEAAGISLTNVEYNPAIEEGSPLPRSFRERATFVDELLGDKGGQIFVCDEVTHCQALHAYFEALIAMAGPYTFTSPSGLVVAQLNSGFTPDQAERYRAVLAGF